MFTWIKKFFIPSPGLPRTSALAASSNGSEVQVGLTDESASCKARGDIYFEEGKLEKAAECYRQAIAINPNFEWAYNNLGNVLREQKLYEEAENCLKQAILIDPKMVY